VPDSRAFLLPTALLLLFSCYREHTIGANELRSELVSAASFAAETQTFIGYLRQQRATRAYADGHLEYLTDEVNRVASELREASPAPGTERSFQQCRTQLDSLANELGSVRRDITDLDGLAAAQDRIDRIRQSLQHASSSL